MTRDVALNLLQNGLLPQVHGAYYEALVMAIQALQTEPCEDIKDALHIAQVDRDKWANRAKKLAKIIGIRDCDIDQYKQEPCEDTISRNDTRIIHTDGLEECIRCAMCTNPMANDRGCDGECEVNKTMYKNVLDVIDKRLEEIPSVQPEQACYEDKMKVLEKIRVEIEQKLEQEEFARSVFRHEEKDYTKANQCTGSIMAYRNVLKMFDKYMEESEV